MKRWYTATLNQIFERTDWIGDSAYAMSCHRAVARCHQFVSYQLIAMADAQLKVDINSATLAQLKKVPAIGKLLSQRIIEERPFESWRELERIFEIGPKRIENLKKFFLIAASKAELKPTTTDTEPSTSENTMQKQSTSESRERVTVSCQVQVNVE